MVARSKPRKAPRRAAGFPAAAPAAQGLAPEPLAELRRALRREVELGALAGAAHIILRRGRCVLAHADGWANKAQGTRFGLRTLCRLHGCTKPLLAAAFLTLVDGGRVKLSDPVAKYIPFSEQVAVEDAKPRQSTIRPTLRHLLTMTAGLEYHDCRAYAKVMRGIRQRSVTDLAGMCDGLAKAPLQAEPGACYAYSFSTDVLGRVCEAVSGQRLDRFIQSALLRPLGMRDTHFELPPRKRSRLAVLYDCKELPASKRLRADGATHALHVWDHPESAPGILSGGGGILSYKDPGMLSTAQDYAKFCQMLLSNGRSLDGRLVLRPRTVKLLWADSLAPYGGRDGRLPGWHDGERGGLWDRTGWSLLNTHITFKDLPRSPGKPPRVGQTMWMGGGGGTSWVIDPAKKTVSLSFAQSFGGRGDATDFAADASATLDAALEASTRRGRAARKG